MSLESPIQELKKQSLPTQPEKSQEELRTALESKLLASKPAIEEAIREYEQALKGNLFEDKSGEEEGSGEKRQEAMQKKLLGMVERSEKMKAQLDSGEKLIATPEADTSTLEPFLKETFEKWYDATAAQVDQKPSFVNPEDLDYPTLKSDTDPSKFGEYTLNPECIGIDYEKATIIAKDITTDPEYQALPSKDLAEVAKYIIDTYGKKYILPDLSFFQWAVQNPTKAHTILTDDSKYYFTFGSVLRYRDGGAEVPDVDWRGSEFSRNASRLDDGWGDGDRVVLLER